VGQATLDETIEQLSILTNIKPKTVIVDKGYQGVNIEGVEILKYGLRSDKSHEGDDQAAQCHRASHWVHEDGREIESKPAQRRDRLCAAYSDVRGRPQHKDAAEEAAVSMCPVWT
jgi:hypothetical protein